MAILDIVTYPAKSLSQPTKKVEKVDEEIRKIIEDMADTMYDAPGVGLAAIQVGIDKSIIVYDETVDKVKRDYNVLVNPEIVSMEGEFLSEGEGCLSVPEFTADVKRAKSVVVEGLDKSGNEVKIEADGYLAVILQHEIDHLNGILFIDRISKLKRELYKRKVKKQLRN